MILLVILSGLHGLLFLAAALSWRRIKPVEFTESTTIAFTILIPVRNESVNILDLLKDLEKQTYPMDQFEVIVLDDHSEDETARLVADFSKRTNIQLTLYTLPVDLAGKKHALTQGVELARYSAIITTDGDCRIGENWLATYASYFQMTGHKMLVGPVRMTGDSFFESLQILEFGALIGFGAAALQSGNPSMCNGANLAYQKSVFQEVNGYEGNFQIPSGDDEFLLQKVFKRHPHQVSFIKDQEALVCTPAKESLKEFVNQRVRWSGKWKHHKSRFVHTLALLMFCDYLSVIVGFILTFLGLLPITIFIGILLIRYLSEVLLVFPVSRFLGVKYFLFQSLAIQIIYPFCVSFLGFASIFGHYSWKGRSYK